MIKILDKQVADKIAAGEVIERPVSIIKELIENSLDAGADSIVVEIKKGGKKYIRVTDNGCGIASDEAETAFLRHATSKISSASDLDSINTLGFRGEALASICAVTRTELLTKKSGEKTGTRLVIHGGEIISHQATGCPDGTTMIVTDLFYNTPARLKFMKSDSAETSLITDMVSRIALAYKDVSFRLINNGNILFSTKGDGNRLENIARIFSSIDTRDLVPLEHESENMRITGFISTPAMSRTTRSGQIFFVNGRSVISKVMERGVSQGYRERLFEGRYPVALLFLEVKAEDLDVNIHPNKKEVRFNNEKETELFITEAVKKALSLQSAVTRGASIFRFSPETEEQWENEKNSGEKYGCDSEEFQAAPHVSEDRNPLCKDNSGEQINIKTIIPAVSDDIAVELPTEEKEISLDAPSVKPFDFDDITIKGIIFDTYIVAEGDGYFYLIDQHAAHERIFYEKLVKEYLSDEKLRQPILMPLMIETDISAAGKEAFWLPLLSDMGFSIENFGGSSYRITEIPTFMELSEAEKFVYDFIDGAEKKIDRNNSVIIDKLITRSCKSAVKAHDRLSAEEAAALLNDLKKCTNPFSCPHGRPTFVRLSLYEIERMFRRV